MEVPRIWRLQETRYGTPEGGLRGSECPVCGRRDFPSREGTVCPDCNWHLDAQHFPEIKTDLGVGVLLFAKVNGVLNLVLFKEICELICDNDQKKLERICSSIIPDRFSKPSGLNTVTGKVDGVTSISEQQLKEPTQELMSQATQAIQREVLEEAGLDLSPDKFALLSTSEIVIDQFRGKYNEQQQPIIHRFLILAFAAFLSETEFSELQQNSDRELSLIDPQSLSKLEAAEFRKATRAILDFLNAALLFIAQLEDAQDKESILAESIQSVSTTKDYHG